MRDPCLHAWPGLRLHPVLCAAGQVSQQHERMVHQRPAGGSRSHRWSLRRSHAALPRQIGVIDAVGFFDPLGIARNGFWSPLRKAVPRLGFSEDRGQVGFAFGLDSEYEPSDPALNEDEKWFRRLREAELKHGRISMLAAMGFLVAHKVRLPGFGFDVASEGISAGLSNDTWQRISLLIFIFCGQFERNQFRQEAARQIGDFGDPLKLKQYTPEMRLTELINGRVAMLSCLAIFAIEQTTGKPATEVWYPFE
ncbi:FCPA [Symbiodinium necroappetens]|uniref:FCPA protein n=1 Tax=Symbiodinium necroappetens TaxID=1628268 RepID=A0A812LSD4_9DINO|nr:FCPA [Symbiodinium necroappetens]